MYIDVYLPGISCVLLEFLLEPPPARCSCIKDDVLGGGLEGVVCVSQRKASSLESKLHLP